MILNILFTIFVLHSFLQKDITYEREYLIASNVDPVYIYWVSDTQILVSDISEPFFFDLDTREKEYIEKCDNCIAGYDRELLFCEYAHKEIQSENEFSTTIYIKDKDQNILKKIEVFPTVIPIICNKKNVILKNAYAFLEQKVYRFDIEHNILNEVVVKSINSKDPTNKTRYISKNHMIVYDRFKNLWVYRKSIF